MAPPSSSTLAKFERTQASGIADYSDVPLVEESLGTFVSM